VSATGPRAPHPPHVATTSVMSAPNTVDSVPAIAFPSSIRFLLSPGRTEPLGADPPRLVAERHQRVGGDLDERSRAADVDERPVGRRPDGVGDQLPIDA